MKRRIRLLLLTFLALIGRPFTRRRSASVASVLYIKPDHLGDLLLATPVLAALRQRFPAAQITALVGPWSQIVLQRNPNIDALLVCPFPGFERRPTTGKRTSLQSLRSVVSGRSSVVGPYLTLLRYAMLLRAGHYDLAIIGRDDHWWGAALALLAGVPCRAGFAVPECRPFLSTSLPWNPHAHVTAQGLELVQATATSIKQPTLNLQFAIYNLQFPTRFDPSHADVAWANQWIDAHVPAVERLVIIHPGTGGPAKLWFPERWAQVADAVAEIGARVLLTGGPDEQALVAKIAAQTRAPVLALAGQTSVGQLAALLGRATLVLGVDSGPLHLAAAQGVPTLHLYGPGDAGRFGPWGDPARHVVLREELWCSPCGEFSACPRGLARPECMDSIAVARVVARVRRMLAGASASV